VAAGTETYMGNAFRTNVAAGIRHHIQGLSQQSRGAVYLYILSRVNNNTGETWVKMETIAKDLGINIKTARKATHWLVDEGLLTCTEREGRSHLFTSRAIFTNGDIEGWIDEAKAALPGRGRVQIGTPTTPWEGSGEATPPTPREGRATTPREAYPYHAEGGSTTPTSPTPTLSIPSMPRPSAGAGGPTSATVAGAEPEQCSTEPEDGQGSPGLEAHGDDQLVTFVPASSSLDEPAADAASPRPVLMAGDSGLVSGVPSPAVAAPLIDGAAVLPASTTPPVVEDGPRDLANLEEFPESFAEVDEGDCVVDMQPAQSGPQVLGLLEYFRCFKDHEVWHDRSHRGETQMTELEAAERYTWAYRRYVAFIQNPPTEANALANSSTYMPSKSVTLATQAQTAAGGRPVDPLTWFMSTEHWENWLAFKRVAWPVTLWDFAIKYQGGYDTYRDRMGYYPDVPSSSSTSKYLTYFGPEPWQPPTSPVEQTVGVTPAVVPAAEPAPAPKRTYTKEELAATEPLAIIETLKQMELYLNYDKEAAATGKTEGKKPAMYNWWKYREVVGDKVDEHVEKWDHRAFTGYYWYKVTEQRVWAKQPFTLPPFGKLSGQFKNLLPQRTKQQWKDFIDTLYFRFELVQWVMGTLGTTLQFNEDTINSGFVRGKLDTIMTEWSKEYAEAADEARRGGKTYGQFTAPKPMPRYSREW
jgi:hypothetical protein